MKIAFVGKGGSGKSSVSWLATQVLLEREQRVLAVDADHNMDLAHLLGTSVDDSTPTLHRAHDQFLAAVDQEEDKRWFDIVLDGRALPSFTLCPKDDFTAMVTTSLSAEFDFMAVGLGAEDVLFSSRCAHGHSAPLKYYLPLLTLNDSEWSVIDGVAGVDMMNFGLFTGADAVVVVVEPHPNSIRVYREVSRIAEESGLPVSVIINKARLGETLEALRAEAGDRMIAELSIDEGVLTYEYAAVSAETKEAMRSALDRLCASESTHSGLERLRAFEAKRQAVKA
jgi:CO dehydrogenase nickel-insertion accessory protein CooC1